MYIFPNFCSLYYPQVNTTSITQSANELLGKKEQKLYYLIITTAKGQLTINVGQKTHDEVQRLTEVVTNLQIDTDLTQKPKR